MIRSNDIPWENFYYQVRKRLIEKVNDAARKKDPNYGYYFFKDRIHDEDIKFELNDRYDNDIEF